MILVAVVLILLILGVLFVFVKEDISTSILGLLLVFMAGFLFLAVMQDKFGTPKAIDVYRGKTTLKISYVDSVAVDSIVVFKKDYINKKQNEDYEDF